MSCLQNVSQITVLLCQRSERFFGGQYLGPYIDPNIDLIGGLPEIESYAPSFRASVHVESSEYDSLGRLGNRSVLF